MSSEPAGNAALEARLDALLDEAGDPARDLHPALAMFDRLDAECGAAPPDIAAEFALLSAAARAVALKRSGRDVDARSVTEAWWERASACDVNAFPALVALGRVRAELATDSEDFDVALTTYDRIIEVARATGAEDGPAVAGHMHLRAALVERARDDHAAALARLDAAIDLMTPDPASETRELIGEALVYKSATLHALGRLPEAVRTSGTIFDVVGDIDTDAARAQIAWADALQRDVLRAATRRRPPFRTWRRDRRAKDQ